MGNTTYTTSAPTFLAGVLSPPSNLFYLSLGYNFIDGGPGLLNPATIIARGFYLDTNFGYALVNWDHYGAGVLNPVGTGSVLKNGKGGFSWGGDFGYLFTQYLAFEVGAYDLPTVRGTVNGNINSRAAPPIIPSPGPVKVRSWLLYFAPKIILPIWHKFQIYGKAGLAERFVYYTGSGVDGAQAQAAGTANFVNDHSVLSVVLGTGMQYWFTRHWVMNVQYLHFTAPSNRREFSAKTPVSNLVLAGVGYKF